MGFQLGNGRLRIGRRRRPSGCIVLIIGVVFIAVSLFFFRVILPDVQRDSTAIEESFVTTLAEFDSLEAGDDVVVTGEFSGNETVQGEAIAIQQDKLIRVGQDNAEWRWQNEERELPALSLAIDGGTVQTAVGGSFNWGGEGLEVVEPCPSEDGETYSYNGEKLTEGAVRTYSLENGDSVTLLGSKTDGGAIRVRELFAGDREGLGEKLSQSNLILRLVAYLFGGVGLLAILGGIGNILRGRL